MPPHKLTPLTAADSKVSQHNMVPQTPASAGQRWTVFGSHDFETASQSDSAAASTSDAADHHSYNPGFSLGSPRMVKLSST